MSERDRKREQIKKNKLNERSGGERKKPWNEKANR